MPKFAPGTAGYDEARDRRFRHKQVRAMNTADLLSGLGMIAQQLGNMRRARQEEANQQVMADYVGKMYGGGDATGAEPDFGGLPPIAAGAASPSIPSSGPQDITQDVLRSGGGVAGGLEKLGQTFGFGQVQGRLTPSMQLQLLQAQQGIKSAADEKAYRGRQEARDDRRVAADEMRAQADMINAGGKNTQGKGDSDLLKDAANKYLDMFGRQQRIIQQINALKNTPSTSADMITLAGGLREAAQQDGNSMMARMYSDLERADLTPERRESLKKLAIDSLEKSSFAINEEANFWKPGHDSYVSGFISPAVQRVGGTPALSPDPTGAGAVGAPQTEAQRLEAIAQRLYPGVKNLTDEQMDKVEEAFAAGN